MTQEQKVIEVAKFDNWVFDTQNGFWEHPTYATVDILLLTRQYLHNLNYLMPIAVKVINTREFCNRAINNKIYFDAYWALKNAYDTLKLDSNNQYTELFEALFNAIKLLENE